MIYAMCPSSDITRSVSTEKNPEAVLFDNLPNIRNNNKITQSNSHSLQSTKTSVIKKISS